MLQADAPQRNRADVVGEGPLALYDPSRFPDWWAGIETVDITSGDGYTVYPDGSPDFPMAQLLDAQRDQRRVTVSCLVSDLRFEWRL